MPGIRKSCDSCRRHKLKCVWSGDDSHVCVRCDRKQQACHMPNRTSTLCARQSQGSVDTNARPTPDLNDRMRRLENLVSGLVPSASRADMTTSASPSLGALSKEAYAYPRLHIPPDPAPKERCDEQVQKTAGRCFLPPPDDAVSLLQEYLHDFNSKIPLVRPERIIKHMRDCYSDAADQKPGPWVLTFTTFGIAHRMRAMSIFAAPGDSAAAEYYLEKSLASLAPLLLSDPSLLLVQCLLGVSILLQTSSSSHRSASFVSIAIRMAQDLSYNDDQTNFQAAHRGEAAERRYAFWIAFFMNTDADLAAARLGTQRLSEIATTLPGMLTSDWWSEDTAQQCSGNASSWQANVFSMHSSLSLIQARMLEELYSMRARRREAGETFVAYQNIASELSHWRGRTAPPPANELSRCLHRSDVVHLIMLEAKYFRTVFQLHASHALVGFDAKPDVFSRDTLFLLTDRLTMGMAKDACRLVDLAALVPLGDVGTSWANTRAILAALFTMLAGFSEAVKSISFVNALNGLESAADQANDTDLAASVGLLRTMHSQNTNTWEFRSSSDIQ